MSAAGGVSGMDGVGGTLDMPSPDGDGGEGASDDTPGAGATPGDAGAPSANGGDTGTGGDTSGGTSATGGDTSGGTSTTGGDTSGGTTSSGGDTSGGTSATGGDGSGGTTSSGGASPSTGGDTGTGGATGGGPNAGAPSGGMGATGGSTATGGASEGGGGSGTGPPDPVCDDSVVKGGSCRTTSTPLCYKACGPDGVGSKTETCRGNVYVESDCSFASEGDYSCYSVPPRLPAECPAALPRSADPCAISQCTVCFGGSAGNPLYEDSSGTQKSGYCVCSSAGLWTCGSTSTSSWPCPDGSGCN